MDAMVYRQQAEEHNESLKRVAEGRSVRLVKPKNAFKYPEADGACFPQHEKWKAIDFRAQNMPMAGYAFRGNRRKYDGEQQEMMENLAKTSHPKMEVVAGGGTILAKTGQRISKAEAELLATTAVRPEVAAIAMAGPADASDAVAAALAEESSAASNQAAAGDVPVPVANSDEAEADHLRRPLVKNTSKAQHQQRARPNSVKKKTKPAPARSEETPKKVGTKASAASPATASAASPATASAASPASASVSPGKKKKKATGKANDAKMDTD